MSFQNFGLSEPLVRAVTAAGYTLPTPIQQQAIPPVLEGRDMLGCAQTGTGKTAAFALPMLHRLSCTVSPAAAAKPIRALVLSPTRELALQIGDSFHEYGKFTRVKHTVIFGGVGQDAQTRALGRGVDVLVATPGRLLDLMNQGYVDLRHIEIFVLDEADRMLDMGFLPDVKRIIQELPRVRQTLLFSATVPPAIRELAESLLKDPARVRIAPVRETTELIEQSVAFVSQPQKSRALTGLLKDTEVTRAIVFTRTKHGADRVVKQLERSGIRAEALHGNKSQNARQRSLANFKSNRTKVLVATDIAARGIDVDNISHVLQFDLPQEPETYVHRIGRTGRAGSRGVAIAFCDSAERGLLKAIERLTRQAIPVRTVELPPPPAGEPEKVSVPREDRGPAGRPVHAGHRPAAQGRPNSGGHQHGRPSSGAPAKPFAKRRRPKQARRPS